MLRVIICSLCMDTVCPVRAQDPYGFAGLPLIPEPFMNYTGWQTLPAGNSSTGVWSASKQRYSPEFKDGAVRHISKRGYSVAKVSRVLQVTTTHQCALGNKCNPLLRFPAVILPLRHQDGSCRPATPANGHPRDSGASHAKHRSRRYPKPVAPGPCVKPAPRD